MYSMSEYSVNISRLGMRLIEKVLAMVLLSIVYTLSKMILAKMGVFPT